LSSSQPPADRPSLAIALTYDSDKDHAPRIVASGRGAIADRMLELAAAHGIAVRADADLAAILAAVEVGQQIPIAAFAAVAEVLFYIYRANERQAPAGASR
jgi:flagellar biosynthesis protein